jgi:flagellar biosynthesis anti-sigma factor FlgM
MVKAEGLVNIMRVNLSTNGMEPPDKGTSARIRHPEPNLPENTAAGVDQAHFSFDQTRVRSLETQVLAQPEIREAKVTALQQAIAKGEYATSANQVADAMLAELGGGQS